MKEDKQFKRDAWKNIGIHYGGPDYSELLNEMVNKYKVKKEIDYSEYENDSSYDIYSPEHHYGFIRDAIISAYKQQLLKGHKPAIVAISEYSYQRPMFYYIKDNLLIKPRKKKPAKPTKRKPVKKCKCK